MMYFPDSNSTSPRSGKPYGGELTHAYAAEGEVKITKAEIITMIQNTGFEAVERDTVYNRVVEAAI